jgi:uncharacterized membrane protein YqjE
MSDAKPGGAAPGGIFSAMRNLAPGLLALARTRVELFALELGEEKAHASRALLLAVLAGVCVLLAFLMLNVLVLLVAGEAWRVHAALGLFVLYALLALVFMMQLRAASRAKAPAFEATLAELKADMEALSRARQ